MLETNESGKEVRCGVGFQNWKYFLIGGGIGAAIALLFAPKPGKELRDDIGELANETLYSAIESASDLKHLGVDYYERGKDVGGQVLNVVSSGVTAIGEEVRRDAQEAATIITGKRRDEMTSELVL